MIYKVIRRPRLPAGAFFMVNISVIYGGTAMENPLTL
jgi:hypothetical protein